MSVNLHSMPKENNQINDKMLSIFLIPANHFQYIHEDIVDLLLPLKIFPDKRKQFLNHDIPFGHQQKCNPLYCPN